MNKQSFSDDSRLGVSHFLKLMYGGEPEWSLFAVKAPIDDVALTFAQCYKAKSRIINVPTRPAGDAGDELANLVAVVQVKNSQWTVVFRSLLWVDSSHLKSVPKEAKKLSLRLKTRAITFFAEDTSGVMAYEIFENDKSLENAEWENGGKFSSFKSTLRKKPALDEVGDEFANKVFREQGIYLPACFPKSDGKEQWLAVESHSADTIERADLIQLQ